MYSAVKMDNMEYRGMGEIRIDDPMNPMLGAAKSVAFGMTSVLALAYIVAA